MLKEMKLSTEVFDTILKYADEAKVLYDKSDCFGDYLNGTHHTDLSNYCHIVVWDVENNGSQRLITDTLVLNAMLNYCGQQRVSAPDWYQYILIRDEETESTEPVVAGYVAWRRIINMLRKYYSMAEIDQCLHSFEAEYDYDKKQKHENIERDRTHIHCFKHCYKFDINGAHNDALCVIFPKAANDLREMYDKRHDKGGENNKIYVNYFVGMLVNKGYRLTYNWIVQRTTDILNRAAQTMLGDESRLIYANTDGIIIQHPSRLIETNKQLGGFKLELADDDVFVCLGSKTMSSTSYWIYQTKDEIKGNMPLKLRHLVNLAEGRTAAYKTKTVELGGHAVMQYDQVRTENREVIIYE